MRTATVTKQPWKQSVTYSRGSATVLFYKYAEEL